MNYRDRLDIIADILTVASQNPKKTQIMYKANLSYKVLRRYLDEVTSSSLLNFENQQQRYVLTVKGKEFLAAYAEYLRTNKNCEEHLNNVEKKRKALEELCPRAMPKNLIASY
jgi:predicted transcriptional regulator